MIGTGSEISRLSGGQIAELINDSRTRPRYPFGTAAKCGPKAAAVRNKYAALLVI